MWTQPQAKSAKSLPPPPPAPSLCGEGGCQVKRSQPHPTLIRPRSLDAACLQWCSALARRPLLTRAHIWPVWGSVPTGRPLAARDPVGTRGSAATGAAAWPGTSGRAHTLRPGLPGPYPSASGPVHQADTLPTGQGSKATVREHVSVGV